MARGDGKSGKTVTDLKRGKAVDDHQVPINGADDESRQNFKPSGETVAEFLDECIRIFEENKALDEKIRTKTTAERDAKARNMKKIATAEKSLASGGYTLASLQALKRQHILRHKAEKVTAELDEGALREHKRMMAAWKDFSTLPLGQAAEARDAQPVH